ncbi:HNH endonuclease signature motif containing protein [Halobacillus salinus]|uniref:HNH endonuclease signature motif containing protein n=1 Tax=Halobacillus salinus TaxID=192814 RepID=UPI0009A88E7A|nr:HNH endonuclease signature motif containing protein [Halobacillus salinus]
MKPYARRFYNSKQWRKCRAAYIATVLGGICEGCGKKPGYIVDHIEPITPDNIADPAITLNHENLQYLCTPCHNRKTFGSGECEVRDGLVFDEDGELVRE